MISDVIRFEFPTTAHQEAFIRTVAGIYGGAVAEQARAVFNRASLSRQNPTALRYIQRTAEEFSIVFRTSKLSMELNKFFAEQNKVEVTTK
jgi:hypothetical protein